MSRLVTFVRFKEQKGPKAGFMHLLTAQKAFETVYMDLILPIHTSTAGNQVIITLIDGFTRFGVAKAYPRVRAEVVAFVRDEIVLKHGLVDKLVCDNGSVFKSETFQEAMKKLGVDIGFTCPYNPQANGRVERWG